MRLAALLAVLLLAAPALAASSEDDYWAARDKGVAAVEALEAAKTDDAKLQAADSAVLADLEKRLIAFIGPVMVKGFAKTPKINPETLSQQGIGVNLLDGLAFAPTPDSNDASALIVTTRPLLEAWLKARAAETDPAFRVAAKPEEALRASNFYTFAFGNDAAFGWAAEIAIEKPAGADFALAGVGRRAQIDGPWPFDRLVVAVMKGGRALIAEVPAKAGIPAHPSCKPIWDKAQAKAEALSKAYADGGAKEERLDKAGAAATEEGSRAWAVCVVERARTTAIYPGLKRQARELAERLAGG